MRRLATIILILFGMALATGAPVVHAQSDRAQVRLELERTDRAIERGAAHLADAPCARGEQLLEGAKEAQRKARGAFLANTRAGTAQAVGFTRQAQKLVAEAIQACQVDFQAHALVENLFDETEQAAQEVRACLQAGGAPEIERLLQAGLDQLDRARDAYRGEQYREAVQRATTARNLIRRALQRCHHASLDAGGDDVGAALDRTDELLAEYRTHPGLDANPRARATLERAEVQQDQARALLARGDAALALRATELARDRALEAGWLLDQSPDQARVERAVELVAEMMSDLAGDIRASEQTDALALLDKAGEALDLARVELRDGNLPAAGRAARIAGTLLQRAAEKAELR